MQVNIKEAASMTEAYFKAGLVPYLHSSPALGKSDTIRAIANKYQLKLIDLRLSQCDPTDIGGLPTFKDGMFSYYPLDVFPLENEPIPEGYQGWLLFLDELSSAPRAVQAASYKLVLDRMIGQSKLHKKVLIACAGNLATDNAVVEDMSTALQSRLAHIDIKVDKDIWLDWAYANKVSHVITSYIEFSPGNLHNFSPDHSDKTFPAPRTWHFVDKLLKTNPDQSLMLPMVAGLIGEGTAREFVSYMAIQKDLPTINQIVTQPYSVVIPNEPSVLYALTGCVAHNATDENIKQIMSFVSRLPLEFQVVSIRGIIKRTPALLKSQSVQNWILENKHELFN